MPNPNADPAQQILFERSEELGRLRTLISAAAGGAGSLVMIEGPAGIGKTALLRASRQIAEEHGMRQLYARGRELERQFSFGVARQLYEAQLARVDPDRREVLLSGAAGLARPLLEPPSAEPAQPAPDVGFTLSHGLYWLTANLADAGPLLIALDDAHFSDDPSLRFVAYLAARCHELPVALVLTVRTGERFEADATLDALRSEPDAAVITPRALGSDAITSIVRERLGDGAEPAFCTACGRASAGNPFLLRELLAELQAERLIPDAAAAEHVESVSPEGVGRAVLARLVRLGPEATALAQAVAILERGTPQQAAALAEIDPEASAVAADRLLAADILTPAPLSFVHPLLRRAVYEQVPPARRAAAHRRAAVLLAAEGVPAAGVAAHLLLSDPAGNDQIVVLLIAAAREALHRGDAAGAARLLRRALVEPPGPELRVAVLAELGGAEALAREPAAVEHLQEALELATDPAVRVRIACLLAELLVWATGDSPASHRVVTRTLAELGPDAPAELQAPLMVLLSQIRSVDARFVAEIEPSMHHVRELEAGDSPDARALRIFDACWRAQTGPYDGDWRELLDDGFDGGRFVAEPGHSSSIVIYAAIVLVLSDEVERAQRLLADVRAEARTRGSIHSHLVDLAWGALLALRRGDLPQAEADARAALALAGDIGALWAITWMVGCLADALRRMGRLEEAAAVIVRAGVEQVIGTSAALHALLARARIRLAEGDRAGAITDFELAGEGVIVNNPGFVPWRSALAEALAGDEPERARQLVADELTRARELGQPRGIGVALRVTALLTDGPEAQLHFDEAVRVLRDSPAVLELAAALIDQGSALRRAGSRSAAREPLREGLRLAQRCGAHPLAERAQAELVAAGARPRREQIEGPEALTPSERRVAELAASGYANREIAQALFITTKTVGTHLAHIYRKLDLSGQQAREQLQQRLADG